ncbi:hypothetical protein OG453_44760 [Streptomyces sp. NBC_01381]|uniref:hypothetical protein n=1 Tax=Streptomyces sp. NBC_01381 TaxID=2903845 RepID=UPI00224F56E5|nr:hypothetical protein [Streptomyces sp. NBC_01381]MCX4673671.1 hypothetical protein [Streptomyces sp. NBC_01381]
MESLVMAAGVLDDVKSIGTDFNDILVNVAPPIAGALFTLYIWGQTKSPLKAFVAAVMAGAIWWGIANMETLRDKTGEDLDRKDNASAQVLVVDVREQR